MTYPTPGMLIVASERVTAYHDPALIPESPEERDPLQNPEINVRIGTPMLVMQVQDSHVQVTIHGTFAWLPRSVVERHTVIDAAVLEEDCAYVMEQGLLDKAPDTIWAPSKSS